jgi:hypothetical protein
MLKEKKKMQSPRLIYARMKKTDRKYVTGRYNGYRRYGIPQRRSTPRLESCDERRRASDFDLLPRDLEPDDRHKILFEPLPPRAI